MPNPRFGRFFSTDSDVYVLVKSDSNPQPRRYVVPQADGTTERKQTQVAGTRKYFIAHFKPDGSYVRSIEPEIPFLPRQIGVFPNGQFVVAGITADLQEPRIALLQSNGQLIKYLDVKNDISKDSPELNGNPDTSSALPWLEKMSHAVEFSSIVAEGNNLLLVRRGSRAPVFAISPSGSVKAIKLKVPDGYNLFSLHVGDGLWVAQYAFRDKQADYRSQVYYLYLQSADWRAH